MSVRLRCAVAVILGVGGTSLFVAACDDGTPPPPRPLPAQTGAVGLQVTTESPAPKAIEITERDVLGKWIIEYSSMRDVMFNRALTVDQQAGTGYTDRQLEEGSMHAVTAEMSRRERYTITSDGKFVIVFGRYHDTIEGTWKLEGDILTLTPSTRQAPGHMAHLLRPHQYKVKKDRLTWIPIAERYRQYHLVRDVPE